MAEVPTPIILSSLTPSAPPGYRNVIPQSDGLNPQRVSFYTPNVGAVHPVITSTYTLAVGDFGKLVVLSNDGCPVVSLPAASLLPVDFFCSFSAIGVSGANIVPSSGLIDGLGNATLSQYEGLSLYSDGENYFTVRGGGVSGSSDVGATSFVGLSDTPSDYGGAAGFTVEVNASGTALVFGEKIYRIPFWQKGSYESDEVICTVNVVDAFALPQNFVGSRFHVDTNPAATWTFVVKKSGVEVGTLSVSTGGIVTGSSSGITSFTDGDILTVVSPSVVDSTGAGLSGTFKGTRV